MKTAVKDRTPKPDHRSALRHITGNIVYTRDAVMAVYRHQPIQFGYKSNAQQNRIIMEGATGWAGLRGLEFQQRVTSRPYPAAKWAATHATHPQTQPIDPEQFNGLLRDVQHVMHKTTLSENETYTYVTLGGRTTVNRLSAVTRGAGKPLKRELAKLGAKMSTVEASLAREGTRAVPATQAQVEWLIHRSYGLHLPEPYDLRAPDVAVTPFDVPSFYEGVVWDPMPGKPYVKVTGSPFRNGREVVRYVAVLSIGRTEEIVVPELHEPWIARAEKLPFPVEWSIRGSILGGREAAKHLNGKIKLINDNLEQLRAHQKEPDRNLQRTIERSRAVEDEMKHSTDVAAARFHGFIRAAVSGRTEEELTANITAFSEHYRDMNFEPAYDQAGQWDLIREFWVGEKVRIPHHKRHQPLPYFAAAMPNMSSVVGDRQGTYYGYTVGTSKRAVMWDPFRAMFELEKSGMTAVIGAPGSGKSSLLEFSAVRQAERGIYVTVIDHSGPMARITYMPRFAGHAAHVDLLRAEPGTLSTYASIPDPNRAQLRDDAKVISAMMQGATDDQINNLLDNLYDNGLKERAKLRQQAADSMLKQLIPHTMRADRDVIQTVADAVRFVSETHVGRTRYASLDDAVNWMVHSDRTDEQRNIGKLLLDKLDYPQTRLFFGNNVRDGEDTTLDGKLLVVMTAAGLTIPNPEVDESDWTVEEQIAIPLLTAANQYASKRIYSLPMAQPKLFIGDEVHVDRRHAAGRNLWNRLARDSRKYRTRVLAGTQLAGDMLDLDAAGLMSETWIGRMEDEDDARAALKMARIPQTPEHVADVLNLSPDRKQPYRDMIFADADGNVDKVRIDFRYDAELVETIKVDPRRLETVDRFVKTAA